MMVRKHTGVFTGCLSRRDMLRGLAGFMIAVSLEGCAQSLSSSSATVPSPTPRPQGSVLYTYHGHTDRITSAAWSPNGKYIASGSLDKTAQVWAANPGANSQPFIYRGHTAGVQAVAWSPDGKYIVSGSADGTVRLWDATTNKQMYVYRGHQASVNSLVWSPDSQRIASGASDKTVQILDGTSGNHLYTYRGHTDVVSSVSWSPDGKYLASGSFDKTVQVWDAMTGNVLYTYNGYNVRAAQLDPTKGVLPDLIFVVAWSHNGKRIAAVTQVYCGDICGIVVGWDASTGRNFTFYLDSPVFALAWSPDDTRFVSSIANFVQGPLTHPAPQEGPVVQISQA